MKLTNEMSPRERAFAEGQQAGVAEAIRAERDRWKSILDSPGADKHRSLAIAIGASGIGIAEARTILKAAGAAPDISDGPNRLVGGSK